MSTQQWREIQDERHRQYHAYLAAQSGGDAKVEGKRDMQAVIEDQAALIQQQQAQIQQQQAYAQLMQAQLALQQQQLDQLHAMLEQPSKRTRY